MQLVSQCLKQDFDNARGVTRCNDFHATRNDRGQRHAKRQGEALLGAKF